jgi:ABC-type transport system involved in cytochrome c biogenesis permease subunit
MRWIRRLGRPDLLFFILPWLMGLLVAGTIAQKYVGLYVAQKSFFSSWILWAGPLPLPGGYTTLALLTVNLTVKLFLCSPWSRERAGTLISHLGVLCLLIGGFLTALWSEEGNLPLFEGQRGSGMYDYHARELVVFTQDGTQEQVLLRRPWETLHPNARMTLPEAGLTLTLESLCRNCRMVPGAPAPSTTPRHGYAARMEILPDRLEMEDEANKSGVTLTVKGTGSDRDGTYLSFDFLPETIALPVQGKTYHLQLRKRRTELPFEVELVRFRAEYHPGTEIARAYASEVLIRDRAGGSPPWKSDISMNQPLRYKGYTLYQASFVEIEGKQASVLAVVHNTGRLFPYLASGLMCVGLLLHLMLQLPRLIRRSTPSLCLIGMVGLLMAHPAWASAPAYNMTAFGRIPILDEGRVKPLDSVARTYLKLIHGRDHLPDLSATAWMAELLFAPERAYRRPIFKIASPDTVFALGLEARDTHRYSFIEVSAALRTQLPLLQSLASKPEAELTEAQRHSLTLFTLAGRFSDLSRSLSLTLPVLTVNSPALEKTLALPQGTEITYLLLRKHREKLESQASREPNGTAATLLRLMEEIGVDASTHALSVVPPQWNDAPDRWDSLWSITLSGYGSPETAALLNAWSHLRDLYQAGNAPEWNQASQRLLEQSLRLAGPHGSAFRLMLETRFHQWDPFFWGIACYALTGFAMLISLRLSAPSARRTGIRLAMLTLLLGMGLHGLGLLMRMLIMGRPPVTSLYESILFVSLASVCWGWVLERRRRDGLGVLLASLIGTLLLTVAHRYEGDGDTLQVLVAVLDTNFWLSTHVVAITIGYASTIAGCAMAHLYLWCGLFRPDHTELAQGLFKNMRGMALVALFFSALGTILGGIWADQSWGRFWGWDPKENGALLVVLWLAWVIHGRLSGHLHELGVAVGMGLSGIMVALAWFGVNLLSVGLHSYGFTQHAAWNLGVFIGLEILLIGGSAGWIANKKPE